MTVQDEYLIYEKKKDNPYNSLKEFPMDIYLYPQMDIYLCLLRIN